MGASRFDGEPTGYPSPTAVPQPLNIASGVEVAIHDIPAVRAVVDAYVQALANLRAAVATALTGAAWIHPIEFAAGAFSLARENRGELCPRGIVNVLGEPSARQAFDTEVFDRNGVEAEHDVECRLVMKIESRAPDAVVHPGHEAHLLSPAVRAALAPRELALLAAERGLIAPTTRACASLCALCRCPYPDPG